MTDKVYPNAVFGCGHLSPIGWCGECAMKGKARRIPDGVGQAIDEVSDELGRAIRAYSPMTGAHEGYAVILEELDELWALVKRKTREHGALRTEMRREACQVAAMAVRFMLDVCEDDSTERADEYTETDDE